MKTDNIKVIPKWSKSKEEIWSAKFAKLEDKPSVKTSVFMKRGMIRYAVAAVIACAIIVPSVAFLYTKDIMAMRGEHLSVTLPDGSTAELNAESHVKFKPFWWVIAREVKMTGEVYFKVEPNRRFTVKSDHGKVTVMGTSFNIYDRSGNYNVTCLSGKVGVVSADKSVILTPGMSARYDNNKLMTYDDPDAKQSADWRIGQFHFESVPLTDVIAEIERQYDIKVVVPSKMDYLYTGHFMKTQSPEQVLEIIGIPFGIKFKIEY